MASMGVERGYGSPEELESAGADRLIEDVDELLPAAQALRTWSSPISR